MKTSEVLRKAGDALRLRGWHQGSSHSDDGRVCAVGAMRVAICGAPGDVPGGNDFRLYSDARETLSSVVAEGSDVRFNDCHGRRLNEVMAAMDAAYVLAIQTEGVEPGDVL